MKITSAEQFETLIAELEKSPCLAKGFQKGTAPANFKQQWEAISSKLNALEPPLRDSDGWQKVWRDYKFKHKKKLMKNKAECNATGGGIYKQLTLCPLEEAVANLLQFNKQLSPEVLSTLSSFSSASSFVMCEPNSMQMLLSAAHTLAICVALDGV
ncbi:PREDICTED: uncharacterized protein LOC108358680 [Rhagoletis zephyria]|uniref:uncharacterized protein LOC108358680 n=1 Tax=Rhagoletis zephyria TaxID=28612 RepID=UPI0008113A52|nr:PREDICTED: uncharacterized protein LOC108358680 [Rhagoletis zephyria]